eukprot:s1647_g4.t1
MATAGSVDSALGNSSSVGHAAAELDDGWDGVDHTAEELDEGWGGMIVSVELEMPSKNASACTGPSTTNGHSLLAQLQSDMECVFKRLEVVEAHLGLSEKLHVERVGNEAVDDTKAFNQNVQVYKMFGDAA